MQSDFESKFGYDIEPGVTREDLMILGAAAGSAKLRGGLPPGPDGLTVELVRALSQPQLDELCALAATAFVERPKSWNYIPVTLLPKGTAATVFSNRLIASQAVARKLYLAALKKVILDDICDFLDVHLGGVKPGDYAPAWISRISVCIAKCKEWHVPLCLGSLDIARAFAIVNHDYLISACHRLGVKDAWICLITRELTLQNIDVMYQGANLGSIRMNRGLVEGIPTSSLLLAIYLTYFWKQVRSHPVYVEHCMVLPAFNDSCSCQVDAAGWVDDWIVASGTSEG